MHTSNVIIPTLQKEEKLREAKSSDQGDTVSSRSRTGASQFNPKAYTVSTNHSTILRSSTQPSLLGSFLGLPISWVIHVKQECSILLGLLGLETTYQPWTDWIGGQMKRDKARMKNLWKTQKLKVQAESWVQAGWVCRDRVKERLALNDKPGEEVSQSGGISPHWTWGLQHLVS